MVRKSSPQTDFLSHLLCGKQEASSQTWYLCLYTATAAALSTWFSCIVGTECGSKYGWVARMAGSKTLNNYMFYNLDIVMWIHYIFMCLHCDVIWFHHSVMCIRHIVMYICRDKVRLLRYVIIKLLFTCYKYLVLFLC